MAALESASLVFDWSKWDLARVLAHTEAAIGLAVKEGLPVTYITEDTVRSSPDHLRVLLLAAVGSGASRVCLCDTAGAALPQGTPNLVEWVRRLLDESGAAVGIDWHGHRDRGLELANTLAAIEGGATRVHGTTLGIGERAGNTATEEILVNLELLGLGHRDLRRLPEYVADVAGALGVTIPASRSSAAMPSVPRRAYTLPPWSRRSAAAIPGSPIACTRACRRAGSGAGRRSRSVRSRAEPTCCTISVRAAGRSIRASSPRCWRPRRQPIASSRKKTCARSWPRLESIHER